jgi:hypothetical protein
VERELGWRECRVQHLVGDHGPQLERPAGNSSFCCLAEAGATALAVETVEKDERRWSWGALWGRVSVVL